MLIIKLQNRKEIFKADHLMLDKTNIYTYVNGCMHLVAIYSTEERAKKVFHTMNNLIEKSVRVGKTMVYKIPLK